MHLHGLPALVTTIIAIVTSAGLAPAAVAADPPEAPEAIETSVMPDLAATRQRFLAGPYAAIWQAPAMKPARDQLDALLASVKARDGVDVWAMMADAKAYREQAFASDGTFGYRVGLAMPPATLDAQWTAMAAKTPADAAGAIVLDGFSWARAAGWLMGAKGGPPAADPADLRVPRIPAGCDGATEVDFLALMRALHLPEAVRAARTMRLNHGDYACTFTPTGSREVMDVTGFHPPLQPVSAAALRGLPADPVLLAAAGIDGKRLAALVAACAKESPDIDRGLRSADQALGAMSLPTVGELLGSLSGTGYLAILRGTPFPGVVIAIPASAVLDHALDALAAGPGAGLGLDLAAARTSAQSVPLPGGVPIGLQVRRTASQWILTSDPLILDAIATAEAGAAGPALDLVAKSAALAARGAERGAAAPEPTAILYQDNQALAALMASALSMGLGSVDARAKAKDPEATQQAAIMRTALAVVTAAGPKLPNTLIAASDRTDGMHLEMDNGAIPAWTAAIGAGMALPAITMLRVSAKRASSGNNERQIVLAALVYANENDGLWPADLAVLQTDYSLPAVVLRSPSDPKIAQPYLYVRPTAKALANQPVLVEDPACNTGKGSMVAFADGHIEFVKGVLAWTEAKRLAPLPKAAEKEGGIEGADWADIRGGADGKVWK